MSPSDPNSTSTADIQSQIDAANSVISSLQNTISRLQNLNIVGAGSTLPLNQQAGQTVPSVSNIKVTVFGVTAGETRLAVTFTEPYSPTSPVASYNIFITKGFSQQSQPTLIGSGAHSPVVCSFQPDAANNVTVFVQTVLSNGQSNAITACPTTTFVSQAPTVNPTDLNLGSLAIGPNATLEISGFTWTANSPSAGHLAWSAGTVVYKGTAYSVGSGSTANPWVYWQLASPTTFQSSASSPSLGGDDFVVAINEVLSGSSTFMPVLDVHSATGRRCYHTGDTLQCYNSSGNLAFTCQQKVSGAGQFVAADGAGHNVFIADGDTGNVTVGIMISNQASMTFQSAGTAGAFNNNAISVPYAVACSTYLPINIGGGAFFIPLYHS